MNQRFGLLLCVIAVNLPAQQVTFDRLLHPEREPQNWLTYSDRVSAWRT